MKEMITDFIDVPNLNEIILVHDSWHISLLLVMLLRQLLLLSFNFFKTKFDSEYQFKFYCSPGKIGDVERFIQTNIRSVRHLETYAGNETT